MGIHLNFEGHFRSPPNPPSWLTQLQQQDWQQRGIVVWDAVLHTVAHLYAESALELLEYLQGNDTWKAEGLVIGSPAFQLSANGASTPSTKLGGNRVLKNKIKLSADQAQTLFEILSAQESLLKRISSYDKEDAKQALNKVYRLIADYGRKAQERKRRFSSSYFFPVIKFYLHETKISGSTFRRVPDRNQRTFGSASAA